MKWTEMQEKAVTAPVSDILVTAAAGSGKTQVLTGRIIDRIENQNADISKMLIITFTNPAAAEMRSRISAKLSESLSKNKSSKRLRRQLALVPSSDISTVHSFCLKLIRTYFYAVDIDPSFKIAPESDVSLMHAEALAEAMDYFYDEENPDFQNLIDLVCGAKNDNAVSKMADKLWRFADSDPFPEKWLDEASKCYSSCTTENAFFADILINLAKKHLENAKFYLSEAISIAEVTEGFEDRFIQFSQELEIVTRLIESHSDWDSLYEALKYKFPTCSKVKGNADKGLAEKCKILRNDGKGEFYCAAALINSPLADSIEKMHSMAGPVSVLIMLTKKAMSIFSEKKREKNVLDFSDCEHLAVKILTSEKDGKIVPSDAALELRDNYDEIYIDEYQDTNDIQEMIFKMVSSEANGRPNLFMVGDMKQSIYRFRHTNPKKFFGYKADTFTDVKNAGENDKHIKISLSDNFRSRAEILDAVNSVFDMLMSDSVGEVNYEGNERLSCGSTYYDEFPLSLPAAELKILSMPKGSLVADLRLSQAQYLAERITELINSGVTVYDKAKETMRPIEYRDIAILMRAPSSSSSYFYDVLSSHGIPVFADVKDNFFNGTEIRILLALLKIIDNPLQDIFLVTVMRSPIFSFSEIELANYALLKKPYLFDAVKVSSDEKGLNFIKLLNKWRSAASFMSVFDFISYLIEDISYTSYVSSMSDGELRLANIEMLLDIAKNSEFSSSKGLFNFLRYSDRLSAGNDNPSATFVSESTNAIRVMSIHKSKGLEFPFVFLVCAEAYFSKKDLSNDILLHNELGIGINGFSEKRVKYPLPLRNAISEISKNEILSEELRLLYVALTRAREHLEILGSVKRKDDDPYVLPEAKKSVSYTEIVFAKSYLDWLLYPALASDKIKLSVINTDISDDASEQENDETLCCPKPLPCSDDFRINLEYRYPDIDLSHIKNKYSVTELKQSTDFYSENEDASATFMPIKAVTLKKPAFLNSNKVFTSAQKGSIMHYVMQHIDFMNSDILGQLSEMNLTVEEAAQVDIEKITAFLKTPICNRIISSKDLHRESPFTFLKPFCELSGHDEKNAEVLIQGVIDCWFREGDELVLLDYKTDKSSDVDEMKKRYSLQLSLYAEALSKKYQLPVKEKLIYMFSTGQIINL